MTLNFNYLERNKVNLKNIYKNDNLTNFIIFLTIILCISYLSNKNYEAIIFLFFCGAFLFLLFKNLIISLISSIILTNLFISLKYLKIADIEGFSIKNKSKSELINMAEEYKTQIIKSINNKRLSKYSDEELKALKFTPIYLNSIIKNLDKQSKESLIRQLPFLYQYKDMVFEHVELIKSAYSNNQSGYDRNAERVYINTKKDNKNINKEQKEYSAINSRLYRLENSMRNLHKYVTRNK
jgi:hypothetical protein